MPQRFDIIVVGGGHAGAEAAWAAASMGASVALITMKAEAIGRMSCNPAIGGLGKGQMVREIDALGGLMGLATDRAGIQFRMLNQRKGPAVWAPRVQADRDGYPTALQELLSRARTLQIIEGSVETIETNELSMGDCRLTIEEIIPIQRGEREQADQTHSPSPIADRRLDEDPRRDRPTRDLPARRVTGVRLADGRRIAAEAVILTTGTFLRGLMHCGEQRTAGGRIGEAAAVGVSAALAALGFELGRLKTGTPPRIHRDTIDYARCEPQPGDNHPVPFSALTEAITQRQVQCWITWTNGTIHDCIRANLHRAPMYSGQIQAPGPRYCPSIEDKVVRFADKNRHQVFLEPEGYENERLYCNGISTSLPPDVQDAMVHGIAGLEKARILQYGYAVEYDWVPTHQTRRSLETKLVAGLFLAGQINGTSGYEEAAAQGLMAGINAVRSLRRQPPVVLRRDQAYIGVMIDDLVTRPPTEPYRMFTSRAEYRLRLRADNADQRLTPLGRELGTVCDRRWTTHEVRGEALRAIAALSRRTTVGETPLHLWMRRPDANIQELAAALARVGDRTFDSEALAQALIEAKYGGYVGRQDRQIERFQRLESMAIPTGTDYGGMPQLRFEARVNLTRIAPATLGQAARISGVNPADVTVLWIYLSGRRPLPAAKSPQTARATVATKSARQNPSPPLGERVG
ncbi:MAG: tRNA uridine-5-carboxymethylaminomethyl(34) synthesis enzyme MnmG [Planctomycetota bacterium]